MQDYNASGAVGNAAVATKEKGEKVIDATGRALAMLLAQIHQLPRSTVVV
jgi:creatinine amidohydrolase